MQFPSTRRSAVLAAASDDAAERRRGVEALIETYWKPLYKFIRLKWSCSPEDAADLTQGFFARAIEKEFFRPYDVRRGSFRTFLRTCVEGYVANEYKSASRLKRGGEATFLSLDFASAEGEFREHPPAAGADPEEFFQREWTRNLFALTIEDLRRSCADRGKQICFRLFERYDLEGEVSYDDLSREFGIPVTTVTNHLAWTRRELRRLLIERLRDSTGRADTADLRFFLGGMR